MEFSHVALAIVAGSGFVVAGMLGLLGVRVSNTTRVAAAAIAAAILLAITISDLIPEAIEHAEHTITAYSFAAGFIILFIIESVGRAHVHHHSADDEHDHAHDEHSPKEIAHHHKLIPFVVGLSVHNIADGIAVGTSTELSQQAAAAVTVGVLVHQLPVGISFAAVLTATHANRRTITRSALLVGAMIPLGALIVALAPNLTDPQLGALIGASAGALTYVACGHLLPEAQSEERHWTVGTLFPVTLLATIALFTTVLGHAE